MSGSEPRPRTVVDTNLVVSGTILKRGNPFALLEAWRARAFELLVSDAQYAELFNVFQRPRIVRRYALSAREIDLLFAELAAAPRVMPRSTVPVVVRDPDDVKILAAALGGDANYLVRGDGDLLEHRGDPRLGKLRIVTAAEFLAILHEPMSGAEDV